MGTPRIEYNRYVTLSADKAADIRLEHLRALIRECERVGYDDAAAVTAVQYSWDGPAMITVRGTDPPATTLKFTVNEGGDEEAIARRIIDLINRYRRRHGQKPLG